MADLRRLPAPLAEVWEWQLRGACRGLDAEVFFPPDRERGPARAGRVARAKQVCQSCPVLDECRRHALTVREPYGVWGGMTAAEREDEIRGHGRIPRSLGPIPADVQVAPAAQSLGYYLELGYELESAADGWALLSSGTSSIVLIRPVPADSARPLPPGRCATNLGASSGRPDGDPPGRE